MGTKVISYGVKQIVEGERLITDEIYRAHRYYNRMVELHRQHTTAKAERRRELFPQYEAAEASATAASKAVDDIVEQIRKANASARRKRATSEETAALKLELRDLKEQT